MSDKIFGYMALFLFLFTAPIQANDFEATQGLNNPDVFSLRSTELERSFNILVRKPLGYDSNDESLPTIYLLDGGTTFPMLAAYYQYLAFGEELPDAIIVGISYGAFSVADGNFRGSDFTAPAESRAHYGGAGKFQTFLKNELLPHIEANYRSDPEKRIIFGQSLGGQFVLYTAQTQPNLFWGHVASNPALHRNLDFFTINRPATAQSNSLLFVSSGTHDEQRFRVPAVQWMEYWRGVSSKPWKLKTIDLQNHGHFSAAPAAFRQGLRWFFSESNR